jgi:glycosyltransferase involved in cell wall biosynthesis
MTISVVICTRNRRRLLQNTLKSLCGAEPPKHMKWELIIVLNDCTDDSQGVVAQFKDRLPIVCATESRPGLSYARNRAIELLLGKLVIWTDDDVRVSCEWLRGYEEAFLRWPEASIFGGPIQPEFENQAPEWLVNNWELCGSAFAARSVPEDQAPISLDYLPYGANFAIRTSVQREFLFDVRLGRRPNISWFGEEELEVLRAILATGRTGRWVPSAMVYHVMPQERQTIAYLRAYYESCGRVSGLRSRDLEPAFSAATCLRDLWRALRSQARFRALSAARPAKWLECLKDAAFARGWLLGRYGTS